jgi:hypothetical protein
MSANDRDDVGRFTMNGRTIAIAKVGCNTGSVSPNGSDAKSKQRWQLPIVQSLAQQLAGTPAVKAVAMELQEIRLRPLRPLLPLQPNN